MPRSAPTRTGQKSPLWLLLLLPFLLECINSDFFLIEVPGSPLTFGSLCLVGFGSTMLLLYKPKVGIIFISFLIIYLGGILGAFFSENFIANLSNAFGKLVLLIGVLGLSRGISVYYKKMMLLLDISMAILFSYWSYYALDKTLFSGNFISYTTQHFKYGALNHHIVGMNISVGAIYLASRLYSKPGLLRYISYCILGMSAICCLLIESRSNIIMVVISALWLIFQERKIKISHLFFSASLIFCIYLFLIEVVMQYDFLFRRFNIEDSQYQESTNFSRITIYQQFPRTFLEYPLGRGFERARMQVGYLVLTMHNQFLSFILGGGILAVIGVVMFWKKFIHLLRYNRFESFPNEIRSHTRALTGMSFVFILTLLTVENGGALFLLTIAIIIFLEFQYDACEKYEKINLNKAREL